MGKGGAAERAVTRSKGFRRKASNTKIANKRLQKTPKLERKAQNRAKRAKLELFEGIHQSAQKAVSGLEYDAYKAKVESQLTSAMKRTRGGKRARKKQERKDGNTSQHPSREQQKSVDFSSYDRVIESSERLLVMSDESDSEGGMEQQLGHYTQKGKELPSKFKPKNKRQRLDSSDDEEIEQQMLESEVIRQPFSWSDSKSSIPIIGTGLGSDDSDEDDTGGMMVAKGPSSSSLSSAQSMMSSADISKFLQPSSLQNKGKDSKKRNAHEMTLSDDPHCDADGMEDKRDVKKTRKSENQKNTSNEEMIAKKISDAEWRVAQMKRVRQLKVEIADICRRILEDPHMHAALLPLLWKVIENDPNAEVIQCAMLSLTKVLCDIVPPYKVNAHLKHKNGIMNNTQVTSQIYDQSGKKVKLKESTQQVRSFEQTLVNLYSDFLRFLTTKVRIYYQSKGNFGNNSSKKKSQSLLKGIISKCSVKCLSILVIKLSHFNFSKSMLKTCVLLLNSPNKSIRVMMSQSISQLLSFEPANAVTVECVLLICKEISKHHYSRNRGGVYPELMNVLLHLPLSYLQSPSLSMDDIKKEEQMNLKKTKSKFEKRMEQRMNKELKELDILENDTELKKKRDFILQKKILESIFQVYFMILKMEVDSGESGDNKGKNSDENHGSVKDSLLPCALEGMCRFSHLVNVELVLDLICVVSDKLKNHSHLLDIPSKLYCILCCLKCMTNRMSLGSIQIDLLSHFHTLYQLLFEMLLIKRHRNWDDNMRLLMECCSFLLVKQHRSRSISSSSSSTTTSSGGSLFHSIPITRRMCFLKRLSMMSLHLPNYWSLCTMHICRKMIASDPRLYSMIENNHEQSSMDSSVSDFTAMCNHELRSRVMNLMFRKDDRRERIDLSSVIPHWNHDWNNVANTDHFNMEPGSLYELHMAALHYHSFTRLFARDLVSWSEIPLKISKQPPMELAMNHDWSGDGCFKPSVRWKRELFRSSDEATSNTGVMIARSRNELVLPSKEGMIQEWFGISIDGDGKSEEMEHIVDSFADSVDLAHRVVGLRTLQDRYETAVLTLSDLSTLKD